MGLENLKELADKTVDLATLVDEFDGTVRSMAIKKDEKSDAEVCYLKVELENGKILTQKLKGLHISELLLNLNVMQIKKIGDIVDHSFHFKKIEFRIGFPRWLPVKRLKQ